MYRFDGNEVEAARMQLELAYEHHDRVWEAAARQYVKNMVREADGEDAYSRYKNKLSEGIHQLMTLIQAVKTSMEEYEQLDQSGAGSLTSKDGSYSYGIFADSMALGTGIAYGAYQMYQFESSGKSLASDFSDLGAFLQTDVYRYSSQEAGMAEWSNYFLMIDALTQGVGINLGFIDEYTEGMMESALAGVLMSLPDSRAEANYETLDQLADYAGIENMDKWIDALKKILSTYAKGAESFDRIQLDQNFKELMDQLPPDLQKWVGGAIASAYTSQITGDTISELGDKIERLDTYIDVIMHCFNDYSVQVAYLDTMENALLSAGFAESELVWKLREMKETYSNDFSYALDKVGDLIAKEITGTGSKMLIKKAVDACPVLQYADLGLSLTSTVSKVMSAEEIRAVKGLNGIYLYDHALSQSYQNYVAMMNAGIATEADMREAEKLYTMLKLTKTKEYEYMLTLSQRRDPKLFAEYNRKYYALTGTFWNAEVSEVTVETPGGVCETGIPSGPNLSEGGGFR